MDATWTTFDNVMYILRITLFTIVMVIAVVCVLDWFVRTRRINPFNPIARFMRSTVDPLMMPIERTDGPGLLQTPLLLIELCERRSREERSGEGCRPGPHV